MKMRGSLVLLLALLWASAAQAQCGGNFNPGELCGTAISGSAGPAKRNTPVALGLREKLTASRTYYVRTAGSDTNCSGRVDAVDPGSGAIPRACAFQTPQKCSDTVIYSLDLGNQAVTCNLTGAYTSGIRAVGPLVGGGTFTVTSATTASITTTSRDAIKVQRMTLTVNGGITLSTVTAGNGLSADDYGRIVFGGITFSSVANSHVQAGYFVAEQAPGVGNGLSTAVGPGNVVAVSNYSITGGGEGHLHVTSAGSQIVLLSGITVTLTGTPNFSAKFAGQTNGLIYSGATFSGSATGPRYLVHRGGTQIVATASRTYWPGNAVGILLDGGNYMSFDGTLADIGVMNLVAANAAAPPTADAGYTYGYFDSTQKRFNDKNDAGVVGSTVVPSVAVSNQFMTGITAAGLVTRAQPTAADIAAGSLVMENYSAVGVAGVAGNYSGVGGAKPTTPPSGVARWYVDSSSRNTMLQPDGFARAFGGTLTADRVYTLQDATGTIALTANPGITLTADAYSALGTAGAAGNFTSVGGTKPTTPPANIARWYVDATGRPSFLQSDGFARTWASTLTADRVYTLPDTSDTLVTLAATQELDNKTLDSSVGKGTWTASGTWTLPAFTLGGTVSGGGNQINNVIIGSSTPLAGAFTTLTTSGNLSVGTASANGRAYILRADDGVIGRFENTLSSGTTSDLVQITSAQAAGTGFFALRYYSSGPSPQFQVRGDGNVTNTNNSYGAISARKYKTGIVDADSFYDRLMATRVVGYRLKTDSAEQASLRWGVIADDELARWPELVSKINGEVEDFNYAGLMMPVVQAVQKIEGRLAAIERRLGLVDSKRKRKHR